MTIVGTVWAARGPSPITDGSQRNNGMVTAIAVNPNDANVIYRRDGRRRASGRPATPGRHWRPLFDRQSALGIGEPRGIAIDPNDTTRHVGNQRPRARIATAAGRPLQVDRRRRQLDQARCALPPGNSGNASQFAGQSINVIIVDPANSQIVYLASNFGVFRSTDGGQNWTQAAGSAGDVRSLVLDTSSPADARILYAGITGRGVSSPRMARRPGRRS